MAAPGLDPARTRSLLRSDEPTKRHLGLLRLGPPHCLLDDDEAKEQLLTALDDDAEWIDEWLDQGVAIGSTAVPLAHTAATALSARFGVSALEWTFARLHSHPGARPALMRIVGELEAESLISASAELLRETVSVIHSEDGRESVMPALEFALREHGAGRWDRLERQLFHPVARDRIGAAAALRDHPAPEHAVALLTDHLLAPDPRLGSATVEEVGRSLSTMDPLLEPWRLDALIRSVSAHEPFVAIAHVFTHLAKYGERAEELTPILVEWLFEETPRKIHRGNRSPLRKNAAAALRTLGRFASSAHESLRRLFLDGTKNERARAVAALGTEAMAELTLSTLREAFGEPSETRRAWAAERLGELGPEAAPMFDELLVELKTSRGELFRFVSRAIGALGELGRPAVPVLADRIEDEELRFWALMALSGLGPVATDAAPALEAFIDRAKRSGEKRRGDAIRTLKRITATG